ncbi:MAG: ATP-binding protein [Aquiluna sp.]|nr:ATP-binding protein [Aquiluna sp.]MCF8545832.1 ATP-binding protein [Aquiluna sp.]
MPATFQSLDEGLSAVAKAFIAITDRKPAAILAIDGPAASGKSTFAKTLQEILFTDLEQLPRVIHMDDLYPGWEGLRAGSSYLQKQVLEPLRIGKAATWQIWNWKESARGSKTEPGNGWREFEGQTPLIVEGCGAISAATAMLVDLRVWIEADAKVRHQRWQERDGGQFESQWQLWEDQEQEFYASEKSKSFADFLITI